MKQRLILFLLFVPLWAVSQGSLLTTLIQAAPHSNIEIIQTKMSRFLSEQKDKMANAKSDRKFLKSLVSESHKKFLKSYQPYAQFNELFENGKYDCLTGTSFFSVLFDELHFPYKIIETNYHIFLLIETKQGQVLLETTDRYFGLKTSLDEIEKCLILYKENVVSNSSSKKINYYTYQADLFHEVKGRQLGGLLYFNQAVVSFNKRDWVTCVGLLEKARGIYDNPRVAELTDILSASIAKSDLTQKVKQELLINLSKYSQTSPVIAIR